MLYCACCTHTNRERPSSRGSESPLPLQNPVTGPPSQSTTTPQQEISIDSRKQLSLDTCNTRQLMVVDQTERVLWPHFLSRLREAFSLDAMSGPEEQDMAAMQAVRRKYSTISKVSADGSCKAHHSPKNPLAT
jgi:hypothetical protein